MLNVNLMIRVSFYFVFSPSTTSGSTQYLHKIDGKKAYDLARAGKEVELKPRKLTIHEIEIVSCELPVVRLKIHCSKGTYIRSIAHDLGAALNSGAYLSGLRRTKIGDYDVLNAMDPKGFQINEYFESML